MGWIAMKRESLTSDVLDDHHPEYLLQMPKVTSYSFIADIWAIQTSDVFEP